MIVPTVGLARDALAAAAAVLWLPPALAAAPALAAELPRYTLRRSTLPCADLQQQRAALERLAQHTGGELRRVEEGVLLKPSDGVWGLVRSSATEPVIRVTVEASTDEQAEKLHHELVEATSLGSLSRLMAVEIHIVGSRSFAGEVADFARDAGMSVLGLLEPRDPDRIGTTIHGLPVAALDDGPAGAPEVVIGTGESNRREIVARARGAGWEPVSLVHPRAHLAPSAVVADGAVIGPGVVVGAYTGIGEHVVLGRGTLVGHHTEIGAFCTVGPGKRCRQRARRAGRLHRNRRGGPGPPEDRGRSRLGDGRGRDRRRRGPGARSAGFPPGRRADSPSLQRPVLEAPPGKAPKPVDLRAQALDQRPPQLGVDLGPRHGARDRPVDGAPDPSAQHPRQSPVGLWAKALRDPAWPIDAPQPARCIPDLVEPGAVHRRIDAEESEHRGEGRSPHPEQLLLGQTRIWSAG